jgi:hypothetical protein
MAVAAMGDGNGGGMIAMGDGGSSAMDGRMAVQSQWQWATANELRLTGLCHRALPLHPCIGQIDVAWINYRIFFTMIFSCQPKWINPIYRRRGSV